MRKLILSAIPILLTLAACSDDDKVGPKDEPFSLDIEVVDDTGAPMEGVVVQLHAPIDGFEQKLHAQKKAKTDIPLQLPNQSQVRLEASLLDGESLRVLYEGALPAGLHRFTWDGTRTDGESLLGTHTIAFRVMVEADGSDFEETTYGVLHTSLDVDTQPVLGRTDGDGKLGVRDRTQFPTLLDQPDLISVDEQGNQGEPIVFASTVQIVLRDADGSNVQITEFAVEDGANELRIVRSRGTAAVEAPSSSPATSGIAADTPTIPASFSLGPVYPSPFN